MAEELSGVRVDIDRKIETYENLTPAELRNAEFQASRLRKKGNYSELKNERNNLNSSAFFWMKLHLALFRALASRQNSEIFLIRF